MVSDHDTLQEHISKDQQIINNVVKIFSYRWAYTSKVNEIRCNSRRLWLHLTVKDDLKEEQIDSISPKLLPSLKRISDSLRAARIKQCATFKDPFVLKAAIILAISSGLLINGLIQAFRIFWQEVPFIIDVNDFRFTVAWLGILIVLVLIISAFYLLGRSARTHLVLMELLLTGTLGAVLTVGTQLRDLNMDLDVAEAQRYNVVMHDKRISKSRRSNSYYLFVDDWLDDEGTKRVQVSSEFYYKVKADDELLLVQKPGYLDYRWVERIVKL